MTTFNFMLLSVLIRTTLRLIFGALAQVSEKISALYGFCLGEAG